MERENLSREMLLDALDSIRPADLTYLDWIKVGMALKAENFDYAVWDEWSRNDWRYKAEGADCCRRKYESFRGSGVTGGTLVWMAQNHGWKPERSGIIGWNDELWDDLPLKQADRNTKYQPPDGYSPVGDMLTFLQVLFQGDDIVRIVTSDCYESGEKWHPQKGMLFRVQKIVDSLCEYQQDYGYSIGQPNDDAGAWIAINPLDSGGMKDENVTDFRYCLVESDSMELYEQENLIRQLQLPVATLTYSGGKSLHAVVKLDAKNEKEWRERKDRLYAVLEKYGMEIDRQNGNPSRLSRLPGVKRGGKWQYLIDVSFGKSSWKEWEEFVEQLEDALPDFDEMADMEADPPKLAEELIYGVLRCGHKMLLSGPSKAGKSYFLIELGLAIATGTEWAGFQCRKGPVLYVNLEIDRASCWTRVEAVREALGLTLEDIGDNFVMWNLRGRAMPLDLLEPHLIRRMKQDFKGRKFIAVIIDPIYKIITGDENNASEMGKFCNYFDRICSETGASAIYCHHHSKGAQSSKKATDRASGSGVFSRDPDAQLDLLELSVPDELDDSGKMTAWELSCSLREFSNFRPKRLWFDFPLHRVDKTGVLDRLEAADAEKQKPAETKKTRAERFREAFEQLNGLNEATGLEGVTLGNLAGLMGMRAESVRRLWKDEGLDGEFTIIGKTDAGLVTRKKVDG